MAEDDTLPGRIEAALHSLPGGRRIVPHHVTRDTSPCHPAVARSGAGWRENGVPSLLEEADGQDVVDGPVPSSMG